MSISATSPQNWQPSDLPFSNPLTSFGPQQGGAFQTIFNPTTADYYAEPINPTKVINPQSGEGPVGCVKVDGNEECKKCFDYSSGRDPNVVCTMSKTELFDPVPMFRQFVNYINFDMDASNQEKAYRLGEAYKMCLPRFRIGWGSVAGFQTKLFEPRSPFSSLSRVKQIFTEWVQVDPNDFKGKMNIRLIDRMDRIHNFTIYFERNQVLDTYAEEAPNLEWKISGIFPAQFTS